MSAQAHLPRPAAPRWPPGVQRLEQGPSDSARRPRESWYIGRMRRLSILLSAALASACSATDPTDAGVPADAGPAGDASLPADAGDAPDAGPDDAGAPDAGAGLPTRCEGACRDTSAAITLNGTQGDFQRAFYGLTAPSQSSTGDWALYVEASSGGAEGCPSEASPTPAWNLIVAAIPADAGPEPVAATASFFDFDGRFLDAVPLTRASAATVTLVAADLCTACVGQPAPAHPAGFVAFDLSAAFPEGAITGHVFATHCDSLDVAE